MTMETMTLATGCIMRATCLFFISFFLVLCFLCSHVFPTVLVGIGARQWSLHLPQLFSFCNPAHKMHEWLLLKILGELYFPLKYMTSCPKFNTIKCKTCKLHGNKKSNSFILVYHQVPIKIKASEIALKIF